MKKKTRTFPDDRITKRRNAQTMAIGPLHNNWPFSRLCRCFGSVLIKFIALFNHEMKYKKQK